MHAGRGRHEGSATKRAVDVVGSAALLVVLSPVLAVIGWLIRRSDGPPAIFSQRRVGQHGRPFDMYKFRTLTNGAEHLGDELVDGLPIAEAVGVLKRESDAAYATRIGRQLRRSGLDELPQLWNVIRGDMSLVGPRPLRDFEVSTLPPGRRTRRHAVRPGMTGTWQVSDREATTWDERMVLDEQYVASSSVRGDLQLIIRTAVVVLRRALNS